MTSLRPVVLVSGLSDHSTRYRCCHGVEQLELQGIPASAYHCSQNREIEQAADGASILLLHRVPHGNPIERLLRKVERAGALVLSDLDDAILDEGSPVVESHLGPIRKRLYQDEVSRYRATLERSAAVLVSSAALVSDVRTMNREAWIHRNAYSHEMELLSETAYRRDSQPPRPLVVGYASGTTTHDGDLESIRPALLRVLRRHEGTELRLLGSFGTRPSWSPLDRSVRRMPLVPWTRLPTSLADLDINLAPLDLANPFNRAKSEVKYIEAALLGIPTIASPTEAFQHAIRSGQNGLLATCSDEWEEHLDLLIRDAALRRRLGEQAREDVRERYSPARRGAELASALNQIGRRWKGGDFWPNLPGPPTSPGSGSSGSQCPVSPPLLRRAWHTMHSRGPWICGLAFVNFLGSRWRR